METYIPQGGSSLGLHAALSTGFPQAVVRVIPSESPSAGICVRVRSMRHLSAKSLLVRICLYVSTGMLGLTSLLQLCSILYRNARFQRGFPRARVTRMSGGIKVTVIVPSQLQIKPGQYINLWIPSISFWSFLQSHPFVVASCTGGQQTTLELLIGPQRGPTSKFLWNSTNGSDSVSDLRLGALQRTTRAQRAFGGIRDRSLDRFGAWYWSALGYLKSQESDRLLRLPRRDLLRFVSKRGGLWCVAIQFLLILMLMGDMTLESECTLISMPRETHMPDKH